MLSVSAPVWFWLTWVPAGMVGLAGEWLSFRLLDHLEHGYAISRRPTLDTFMFAALFGWIMILRLVFVPFLLLMAFVFTRDLRAERQAAARVNSLPLA